MVDDRAQLHTLEGLAASAILLLALTYALNSFVVTPTSDVNPGAESNKQVAEDFLQAASANGELKRLLLHWNDTEGRFINSSDGTYYYEGESPDAENGSVRFGNYAKDIFTERGLSYNVDVRFSKENGTGSMTVVDNGQPGVSAVSATRTVILSDDDKVTEAGGKIVLYNETGPDADSYPIPKDGEVIYNRAEVTVTVW